MVASEGPGEAPMSARAALAAYERAGLARPIRLAAEPASPALRVRLVAFALVWSLGAIVLLREAPPDRAAFVFALWLWGALRVAGVVLGRARAVARTAPRGEVELSAAGLWLAQAQATVAWADLGPAWIGELEEGLGSRRVALAWIGPRAPETVFARAAPTQAARSDRAIFGGAALERLIEGPARLGPITTALARLEAQARAARAVGATPVAVLDEDHAREPGRLEALVAMLNAEALRRR